MGDDAAAKGRIISHMNADHHDSVVRYLEHYKKLSSWTAYNGKITDITLDTLTIKSDAGVQKISLSPPLKSYREARERLVAMDKEAVQALGRSDISVGAWPQPNAQELITLVVLSGFFIIMSHAGHFKPDGVVGQFLPTTIREFVVKTRPWTFWGLVGVHALESYFLMARAKLDKYNVSVRSPAYWQWIAETMIGGIAAQLRFDKLVAQKKKEKAQQKH